MSVLTQQMPGNAIPRFSAKDSYPSEYYLTDTLSKGRAAQLLVMQSGIDFLDTNFNELQTALDSEEFISVDLVRAYMRKSIFDRIPPLFPLD